MRAFARAPRLLLALASALALGAARPAGAEEAAPRDFASLEKAFQADFGSKDAARRLRAFTLLEGAVDLRALDLGVAASDKAAAEEAAVRAEQAKAQEALAKVLGDIERLQVAFETRTSAPTEKDMKAFNARVAVVEGKRDEVYERQRTLDVDLVRARALVAASTAGVGAMLRRLGANQAEALARLEAAWSGPKAAPEQQLRLVDAIAAAEGAPFDERLRATAMDESRDARVRVAAVNARLARGDAGLLDDAVALLGSTSGPVQAAAIDALRRLHKPGAIEPLIGLLAREDIGRLREDAHRALRSLTGQGHGPYAQPWRDWWTGARASFVPPPSPADVADLARPEAGVTYHGITTFSDKILFVLDVSKSMEDPVDPAGRGPRAEEPKIAVAKRELLSALAMLDGKKTFNLVFFGHSVVPYKNAMLPATPVEKERAKAFVTEIPPSGGTNLHDALETGFRMAGFAADQRSYLSLVDTIFFLTDGKPTAGKVQDPERILATVRDWNRLARITIHCIGMGDHDPAFLERLAVENGGKYVRR